MLQPLLARMDLGHGGEEGKRWYRKLHSVVAFLERGGWCGRDSQKALSGEIERGEVEGQIWSRSNTCAVQLTLDGS